MREQASKKTKGLVGLESRERESTRMRARIYQYIYVYDTHLRPHVWALGYSDIHPITTANANCSNMQRFAPGASSLKLPHQDKDRRAHPGGGDRNMANVGGDVPTLGVPKRSRVNDWRARIDQK